MRCEHCHAEKLVAFSCNEMFGLHVPVLDRKGKLRHEGGIVDAPGLYTLGLNFMRRRKSSFIHGTEDDVRELGAHLVALLRRRHGRQCNAPAPELSATRPQARRS